jgi:hypothetical protein
VFSAPSGLKSGQFDQKRKLNGINVSFPDRINRMDRIVTLKQKNPDNPVNLV